MAADKSFPDHAQSSSGDGGDENTSETDVLLNTAKSGGADVNVGVVGGTGLAGHEAASLPFYSLPQWLVGNEKQSAYKFSLDFPAVQEPTRKAIEQYVRQNSSKFMKESTRASHQLHELQREESESRRKVALAQQRLDKALANKQDDLKKLRKEKQKACAKKLQELERHLRQQQAKEWKKAEARMEEETRLNFEKTYEEELRKKKREWEEGDRQQQEDTTKEEAETDNTKLCGQELSLDHPVPKKQKKDDVAAATATDADAMKVDVDEDKNDGREITKSSTTDSLGGDGSQELSSGRSGDGGEEDKKDENHNNDQKTNIKELESTAVRLKIVKLEKKRDKVQTDLDRLNERKKGRCISHLKLL